MDDASFMRLALREARKGLGRTSPNPAVGAVVVLNGKVVGRGWHRKAGTPHAEVHALADAGEAARGATLYVTLEPCNHTGRTPPCTAAILQAGIARVVSGMADPNPRVAGGGNQFLRERGVEVLCGIREEECKALNRPFLKHGATGLPWVIMKAGMSLDGRIATRSGASSWITNERARAVVHRLRDRVDAILVGVGTALADDPMLTTRLPGGRGRDPLRVILDRHLRLPADAKMLHGGSAAATWVYRGKEASPEKRDALRAAGAVLREVEAGRDGFLDLAAVLADLGAAGVTSVLVEGGSQVHGALLRERLADEAWFFIAPVVLGADAVPVADLNGRELVRDAPGLTAVTFQTLGDNVLVRGLWQYR